MLRAIIVACVLFIATPVVSQLIKLAVIETTQVVALQREFF